MEIVDYLPRALAAVAMTFRIAMFFRGDADSADA